MEDGQLVDSNNSMKNSIKELNMQSYGPIKMYGKN